MVWRSNDTAPRILCADNSKGRLEHGHRRRRRRRSVEIKLGNVDQPSCILGPSKLSSFEIEKEKERYSP